MISGIFGLIGSGKTMFLACLAERALKRGNMNFPFQQFGAFNHYEKIYTTFPCKGAYKLDYSELGKKYFHDCLLLIDEIMMFSDSRDYKHFSDELNFFYSQCRKFRIDIVYCSQSYDDCDKRIRARTDSLYYINPVGFGSWTSVRPIRAYFRVCQGTIQQGYELAPPIWTFFFDRSKYYDMTDTNATVKCTVDLQTEPTSILWGSSEGVKRIEKKEKLALDKQAIL